MRTEEEAKAAIEKYADTVRRICFVHLKNHHDTEDVFQEVFLKYVLHDTAFLNEEHEKAWLIRVSINACKDSLKSYFKRKVVPLGEMQDEPADAGKGEGDVLKAVLTLPPNYRDVIYLCYFEGYSAVEAAAILRKSVNTLYTWISRAKAQLKGILGGDPFAE